MVAETGPSPDRVQDSSLSNPSVSDRASWSPDFFRGASSDGELRLAKTRVELHSCNIVKSEIQLLSGFWRRTGKHHWRAELLLGVGVKEVHHDHVLLSNGNGFSCERRSGITQSLQDRCVV